MIRYFYFFTLMFLFLGSSSQTYCPYLGPDQTLPCGVNSTTLTADLSNCSGSSTPRETNTYTVANIPFSPVVPGGNLVTLSDDSQDGPFPIGFTFCFFGNQYTQFWLGSNGWISFSGGQPNTFTSAAIPNTGANIPKNCIMGPWQDWHPGIGGQIRYQTIGTAPCRRLVVSWTNVPMYSCTNLNGTFQIILYEGTNIIENHITNKPNCPSWAGGTAVQGIHNLAGTVAFVVSGRNSTQWTTTNNAWRWTPNGNPISPTLVWYQVGNPIPIATGVNTITVTPPQNGAYYTCHLTYGGCFTGYEICNTNGSSIIDTVFVIPTINNMVINIISVDPLCFNDCNGLATANPINGTPQYTYLWSPGGQTGQTVTGLCPGIYMVTVTDSNGCITTNSVTLNNPQPIILSGPINHN